LDPPELSIKLPDCKCALPVRATKHPDWYPDPETNFTFPLFSEAPEDSIKLPEISFPSPEPIEIDPLSETES
jgi:hypothetical protein